MGAYSSFFLLHLLLASSSASSGVRPRPSALSLPSVIVVLCLVVVIAEDPLLEEAPPSRFAK